MGRILVSGLINVETTLRVDAFPLTYEPVRYPFFGINSTVSGVGYNIAKALTRLGSDIHFLSLIGTDTAADAVRLALAGDGLDNQFILDLMPHTAQSVIIYDSAGRRQIHTDLKDIQERTYPPEMFLQALPDCELAVLCNINYNRPLLKIAQQRGTPIATDVHTIADLEDAYNCDFMAAAHILFMSDERLPCTPEQFVQQIQDRYATPIVVVGLGESGVLLAVQEDHFTARVPAVFTRPIISTIGAGDALFSCFVRVYAQTGDPYLAVRKAVIFASYKIGAAGAAQGFLHAAELDGLYESKFGRAAR